jgi:tetratricopeptide (TPR) repeat protein
MLKKILLVLERNIFLYIFDYNKNSSAFRYFNRIRKRELPEIQISNITEILLFSQNIMQAYYFRGMAHYDLNQYENAIEDFSKCLELDETMHHVYSCRGMSYYCLGDFDNALIDLEKVTEANVFNVFLFRGHIYRQLEEFDKALNDYFLGLQVDPSDKFLYYFISHIYYGKHEYQKSQEYIEQALTIDSVFDYGIDLRGCIRNQTQLYDLAIEDFNWCIRQERREGRDFYNRGFAYFYLSQYKLALDDFNYALDLNYKENPDVFLYKGRTELALESYNNAISDFNKMIELYPSNPKAFYFRSKAYEYLNDEIHAKIDLDKAKILNPHIEEEILNNEKF